MEQVNQVFKTNDYSKFKTMQGNRNVNLVHVRRLKESFEKSYLLTPIIVNKDFEIIDGQHRFQAAKEMGLPVNFFICENYALKEVQVLNSNASNWKKIDYLNAYCDSGNPHYLKLREFMKKFPEFTLMDSIAMLSNLTRSDAGTKGKSDKRFISPTNKAGSFHQNIFTEGAFEVYDFDLACDNAKKILMAKPYYEGFARRIFVLTLLGLFKNPNYSHAKFIQKISSNPLQIRDCATVTECKVMIEDIYNYKSREKVSLRF
jgi:hypothetical protein